jgi:hypothetical protein
MSSGGQIAGAVVGGIVGFIVAGPLGALQGAAFGAGIGAALDPPKGPTIHGPRLSDLSVQTSTYGSFLPRFYGTAPAHGNVFWLEGGKLKEVVRKKKSGGKGGGGGQTTKTYTYYATFAIGLGEGPIAGVRRIWCRDKLIYNAGSDDLETIIASNKNAKGWRLYLGTDDQLPDPRIEAEKGVGNTPAYRGTAYIVFDDFELTKYNNSLEGAQFKFEVVTESSYTISSGEDELPFLASWSCVANGGGKFIALSPSQQNAATSIDGREWSTVLLPTVASWSSIAHNGEFFCGISKAGPSIRSYDGKTWSQHAMPRGEQYVDLAVKGADVCAISQNSTYTAVTSDGETWAEGNFPSSRNWSSVASGLGKYVAIAKNSNVCATSTDGIAWVEFNLPISSAWVGIAFNGEKFIAVSETVGAPFAISDDGESWSTVSSPGLHIWRAIAASQSIGSLVFVVSDAGDAEDEISTIAYSHDLASWQTAEIPQENWADIVCAFGAVYGIAPGLKSFYAIPTLLSASGHLDEILNREMLYSRLIEVSDIDTSLLSGVVVKGYRVQGGTIRASLENLQSVFPFDVRQHGYQLQCVPRGGASVATIPHEHLGSTSGESAAEVLRQSREMDSQLPASTHLKFWDADREYANGEEYADRPGTEAVNRVDREVPIVLTATEAARAADVLQQLPWLERTAFELELPPTYGDLEPADVITVTTPGSTYLLRLTEINDSSDMVRKCKAKPAGAAIYNSVAVGGGGNTPPQTISLAGPSLFLPLDIPLVDEVSQTAPGFVGVMTGYNGSWPGAIAVRSADGGQTFEDIQAFPGKATVGVSQNALADHAGYLISSATLTLSVISGELESITQDQLLTGYNYAAYGVDGRWEIVRFRDATLNANGTYTLSGFVRGDKGTEWATGLHQVGDYFVLLDDPDNAFIGMSIQSIGLDRIYRGVTSGASLDDADDVTFSYDGVNLEPLSAVNVTGARDGSQNFTGSFYRRSRLSSTWWTNGVQAPVGETTEAYEIDVMNGSSVVRTISSSTTSFSYTAAQQTTDFGSAQASITFRIYQLSEVVGRGYVREVTL